MQRKIVQHGMSSLTITLPRKWADKFGLKKGDEINVMESGPSVIITTKKGVLSPKKEVTASDYGVFDKNDLSHLYHLGYDEVEIRFEDPQIIEDIKKRLPDCIGYEIIDQKEKRVYIRSIATTLESEFDILLRKSFLVINEMARNMLEAIQKGDYEKLKEARTFESLNNKFTNVCIRILNKQGYEIPQRTLQIHDIIKDLERIADEFKHICDLLDCYNKKLNKDVIESFKQAIDYYLAFYNIFYKFDPELKKKIHLERITLIKKYTAQLRKSKDVESVFLYHLLNIIEKTYNGAGSYFAFIL